MGFAVRLAVLCAAALLTIAARPVPPSLTGLFERMRAANDGLYRAHVISTSKHIVDGEPAVLTTHVQDLRYLQNQCTEAVCLGTYFDGERLFSVNINGTALPRSQAPEAHVRSLRILAMEAFLDPQFEGDVYDEGMVSFRGMPAHRIDVSDYIAMPMQIFVDPRTGLVLGAQDITSGETYVMREYRRVGRFVLPFEIDLNGAPLEEYLTRTISNDALPQPRGLQPRLSGSAPKMTLDPASISPLGTCTLAGASVPCLIDSGNSAMSMSVELAEQLNLPSVGMLRVAGLGNYATEVVRAGPLRMGDLQIDEANYIVLSDIHRYGYDLVIGADLLAAMPVTIDYKKHVVYFDKDTALASGGATVPLAFENFVPVVNVKLDDAFGELAVDTGDQSSINLGYDFYREHPGLFETKKTENVSGVGGESVEMIGEIGKITLGSLTAEHQQIGTTKTLHGTADGHLGAGFLSKYRVVLDYAHQLMRLLPL